MSSFDSPATAAATPDWEKRFRSSRATLPRWGKDNPNNCVLSATVNGVLEVHALDAATGTLTQVTSRPHGTYGAHIDPSGELIWWFDDTDGNEFGVWRIHPFSAGLTEADPAATDLEPAYPSGLALGRNEMAVVGRTTDSGSSVHLCLPGTSSQVLYAHPEQAWVAALSADDGYLAIAHSEHQDSRRTAVRVLSMPHGKVIADLWDGPGLGLEPLAFSPLKGDPRLLVRHERSGHGELLIWNPLTGEQTEVALNLPGDVYAASWFPDGASLLVNMDNNARTRLFRVSLVTLLAAPIGPEDGTVSQAVVRTNTDVWMLWSSAAVPPAVRTSEGKLVVTAPGSSAPASVPIEDVWVDGPGGMVHALLRRPSNAAPGALPLVIDIHGGPTSQDTDAFRAAPAAWVDHGYAVVQVNYRGSTGYGTAWRNAIENRVGHTELEDIVAVRDHLVARGIADPERIIISGDSWGGYLALLGAGVYPQHWALSIAGIPVADYVMAYEDSMESLKAFDRSLFGGSPEDVPHKYRDSSPITYVPQIECPVLILAGENDPRCPIRQIESYEAALREHRVTFESYRYDAGHGSLVDDERVRQTWAALEFASRYLPRPAP